jgi:hypothetical protein
MSGREKAVLGLVALCLLTIAAGAWKLTTVTRERDALRLAPQKTATITAAARVETVTVRLAGAERVVLRELTRVRTDTLMLAPRTREDTVTALVQLPVLAAAHDSLQRSCSAFVVSCGEYRVAAEQRFAADSVYRVGLEAALRGAAPSRLGAVWNRIKLPLAFAGGLYLGSRVR